MTETTMNTSLPADMSSVSTEEMMKLTGQLDINTTKPSLSTPSSSTLTDI